VRKLVVVVEGYSEERFVMRTLRAHLPKLDVRAIKPATGTRPDGSVARGGGDWKKWLAELRLTLGSKKPELVVTTMFDLYGLPSNFPGVSTRSQYASTAQFADALELTMASAVSDSRFVPNIVRHEFETLVLAALPEVEQLLAPSKRRHFAELRRLVAQSAPEEINCGDETAPSKRLEQTHVFDKLIHGVPALHAVGVPKLERACPRFGRWVRKLKSL
jgi:hypothetical protein